MNRAALRCIVTLLVILPCGTASAANPPGGVLVTPDPQGFLIDFSLPTVQRAAVYAADEEYTLLQVEGYGRSAEVGLPQLPLVAFNLVLDASGASPEIEILSVNRREETLSLPLYPAQEPWPKDRPLADRPFSKNSAYYASRGTPAPFVTLSEPFTVAGVHGVTVAIRPFSYEPSTGRLITVTEGSFRIRLASGVRAAIPHSSLFESYLAGIFAGYGAEGMLARSNYLIITAPEFEPGLAGFASYKQGIGYDVHIATTGVTGTTNTAIKAYIQNRYDNPLTRPEFILLVGDVNRIPEWVGSTSDNPHTDITYTLLDGPDYYADAHIGRFAIDSLSQLGRIVAKSMFMESSIFGLRKRNTFLASTDNWSITEGTHNFVIDTFFIPNGYVNNKRYTHTYNATTAQVIGDLNEGRIFAIYSGHGSTTGWSDGPPISQSDVRGLLNTEFPHVYSFACLTGQFNLGECFGETWIRGPRGAATFWGSSVTSYWDEDDILERGLFRAMFTDHLTRSTPMFNMAKVYLAQHYGGITPTVQRYFEMYNLLGDPSIHTASFTANFGWVEGTITGNGLPLADVAVDILEEIPQQGGMSDGSGAYMAGARVDTPGTSMTVHLRARKFGWITTIDTLTMVRDDTVHRTLVMFPAASGTLTVRTFRSDSAALGVDVDVIFEGQTVVSDSTDPVTGLFTTTLPEGSYHLRLDGPPPYRTATFDSVTITAGSTTALDVLMRHVLEVFPDALADTLVVGQQGSTTLRLTNTTPDPLGFRLSDDSALRFLRSRTPPAARRKIQSGYELPKEVADPHPGSGGTEGRGGPDPFGYEWIDSDEPGGPVFAWTDISTTGTRIMSWTGSGDDGHAIISLPFPFPFYGVARESLKVVTNGWISFAASSSNHTYSNTAIPTSEEPNDAVYLWWDDLTLTSAGAVHYLFDAPNARFIVQWTDVPHYGTTTPGLYTFQVVLYPNGGILAQYRNMQQTLNSATLGIENGDGSMGLQVAFNTAYMHDSLAIAYRLPDAPWVSETPGAGTLPPGGSQDIAVLFDAAGLTVGTEYRATIFIAAPHPDVAQPWSVPVLLRVQPADSAVMLLSASSVTFPLTPLFTTRTDSLTVRNGGALPLAISSISVSDSDFAVTPSSIVLAPGDSGHLLIMYTPTLAGTDTGRIILLSNSQGMPRIDVSLSGSSQGMPAISVNPASFTVVMPAPSSDTARVVLTILNPGTDTLRFTIAEGAPSFGPSGERSMEQQPQPAGGKNHVSPAAGPPHTEGRGGPDAFGYTWIDSDEPGGPPFAWFDIATVGTPITTWTGSPDDGSAVVPLPFPFPFYGVQKSSLKICTNGWIGFDAASTTTAYSNGPLPSASTEPNNAIYPWWDDLDLSDAGSVHYYHDAAQGRFIVQYTNVPHYGATGVYTFQIILFPGGSILCQYLDMQQTLNSATIGIENPQGTIGLQVAYNSVYVHNGLAVLVSNDPVSWMSCTPDHGLVAPADSMRVTLAIHPTGMAPGSYLAHLLVAGNAPDSALVPVQLDLLTGVGEGTLIPTEFALEQNYPNPFNPATRLTFDVPAASHVALTVYDVLGRPVASLVNGTLEAGRYTAVWNAQGAATGVYFARMEAHTFVAVRKLMLVK